MANTWSEEENIMLYFGIVVHGVPPKSKDEAKWRKIIDDSDMRILSHRTWQELRRRVRSDLNRNWTRKAINNAIADATQFHMTLPPWDQLPWDVLDVISQKLDFGDLFQFSRVCTNWRVFHKSIDESNFMASQSQEPLLLEVYPDKVPCSFTSLPKQKVYPLKNMMKNMMSYSKVSFPIYVTFSSGYFVIIADNSSFLLINPFMRITKKVTYPSTFKFSPHSNYHALLAFEKSSEEFVLVFLFEESNRLHVYQSRNNDWVTYSSDDCVVVDFVAFNNMIYVVTKEAEIGVLSLNSANIEFLNLENTPNLVTSSSYLNLVKCDQELLLVRLNPGMSRKVYKIDFSTMSYVKLKTLGNIALFYVWHKSCKALSNPEKWGYESNSVYEVSGQYPNCMVYNWDTKSKKYIAPPSPKTKSSDFDWCFRHLKYEIDYSLVE